MFIDTCTCFSELISTAMLRRCVRKSRLVLLSAVLVLLYLHYVPTTRLSNQNIPPAQNALDMLSEYWTVLENELVDFLAKQNEPTVYRDLQNFIRQGPSLSTVFLCKTQSLNGTFSCEDAHDNSASKNSAATFCSLFRSKKVLFVGPMSTYHLHLAILRYEAQGYNAPSTCLGPEFCTFHHICKASAYVVEDALESVSKQRMVRPPSPLELAVSGSALIRYMQSYSLDVLSDSQHSVIKYPFEDPETAIRVKESYWIAQARRSNLIIMNRGPIPPPSWTYTGNWSFVDRVPDYLNHSLGSVSWSEKIFSAALHTTLSRFLPSLLRTLEALRSDPVIMKTPIVWHSSWYVQPGSGAGAFRHSKSACRGVLESQLRENMASLDPWAFYYNAQVFMQAVVLRTVLPLYAIAFLPEVHDILGTRTRLSNPDADVDENHGDVPYQDTCLSGRTFEQRLLQELAIVL